jgi:hypothetical protein
MRALIVYGSYHHLNTFGLLWLVGGIQRGKPDEADVERARAFAEGMKKRA